MNKTLDIGLALTSLVAVALTVVALFEVQNSIATSQKSSAAQDLSVEAQQFETQFMYYRLQVWKYSFDPNEGRLQEFENADSQLTTALNELNSDAVNRPEALYPGAAQAVADIKQARAVLATSTSAAIESANAYGTLVMSEAPGPERYAALTDERAKMFERERIFYGLSIERMVSDFVARQQLYSSALLEETRLRLETARTVLVVLSAAYLALLLGITVWLRRKFPESATGR